MSRPATRLPRSFVVTICAALVLVCCASAASALARPGVERSLSRAKPAPQHLLIYAQEWSLWPSRTKLTAGTIDVQLWNRGEDAHDTRVRRLNSQGVMVGPVLAGVSVTPSGAIHTAVWHLKPGKYEIYCSLPGHLMMGMHAKLSVVG